MDATQAEMTVIMIKEKIENDALFVKGFFTKTEIEQIFLKQIIQKSKKGKTL